MPFSRSRPFFPIASRSSIWRAAASLLLVLSLAACQSVPGGSLWPGAGSEAAAARPATPSQSARPPVIALALGGGAARGFAHVGVIKALEARGIFADIIVGTSAGSLVGALYASGMTGIELNRVALAMDEASVSDWALPSRGLFKGAALQDYVNRAVGNRPIEKFQRRFAATATDLNSGQLIVFERGNAGQAVRASSAVPGVFEPVRIGAHEYVDGGLVTPVPVRVARRMGADLVIAVDISARPASGDPTGVLSMLLQTFAIMGQSISALEVIEADIVIRPDMGSTRGTDFAARNSSVLAGEQAVMSLADQIRQVVERKKRELGG